MKGITERRRIIKSRLPADALRLKNEYNSIAVQILNENNDGQFLEMDNNYAQHTEHYDDNVEQHVEHYDDNNSGVENLTLVIYENKIDNYGRILTDFNILKEIMLMEENMNLNLFVEGSNDRIHPSSKITKAQFAEGFHEFCEQSRVTMKDRHLLACLWYNTMGDICDLPIIPKRKAVEMNNNDHEEWVSDEDEDFRSSTLNDPLNLLKDTAVDDTRRYTLKQSRFFTFDQCDNDCTVFLGENNRLFCCPTCKKPRFRVCSKNRCKTKGCDTCEHLLKDGSSFKKLYYRPIIILIQDLLANPNFEYYLNYECRHNRRHNSKHLSDFMDGEIARAHLDDMKKKGRDWIAKDPNDRGDYILINLLLSEFYDSGQLFKSYVFDYWPLCIGILNMPPPLRGKVGLSYFLAALYTGKHTVAERIMFNDLVCEELRQLYLGIHHEINGKQYYIQARLVMHILDTKAAEPVMGYQSQANSNFGCSNCGGVTGIHIGNQCVFLGNRNYLPQLNVLRFFGQTGKCCPAGFYDHEKKRQWYVEEHFHHLDNSGVYETFFADRWKVVGKVMNKSKAMTKGKETSTEEHRNIVNSILSQPEIRADIDDVFSTCEDNDETKSTIVNFMFHEDKQYQWFHTGEFGLDNIFDLFGEYLYYRHQDYRTQKPYRRVSYDQYVQYAKEAEQLNFNNRAKKKQSVHGIQGMWYWARLQYADLETQFTWPLVHAISGVVVKVLKLIINDHYHKGSTIVHYKISKLRAPKEKNRQRVRGVAKGTKAKGDDSEIEEDDSENEEGGNAYEESDKEDEDDPFSFSEEEKRSFRPPHLKRKAPYQVFSKANIDCVQAWLDCVLLPPALSDDWKVSLTSPSSMKISQKIRMLLCYWNFVMESLEISMAYKKLFRMFANDMTRLLSHSMDKSEVDNLLNSVIETNAVWEGMMPTASNSFQVHELVDLPLSFLYYGPPWAVSELPGERMMKIMKDWKLKSNMGGNLSFLQAAMRKQIYFETWKMRSYSKWPSKDDSHFTRRPFTRQLIYNEFPFELHTPERHITKARLNPFEVNHLCSTLYAEVIRNFGGNTGECEESAIYRIFNNKRTSRLSWIEKLNYYVNELNSSELSATDVEVAKNLINFQPDFHRKALVYGTKFYSRGSQCRETKLWGTYGCETYSPSSSNAWQWFEKAHYRSWCKFQCPGYPARYGLLNAFFSVSAIGDKVLKNLLVASMTSFEFDSTSSCKVETVDKENSLAQIYFVALQDIYPSQIGTIPFTADGLAMTISNAIVASTMKKYVKSRYDDRRIKPHHDVMILLHPDRLSLQPTVEERAFSKFMFS